LKVNKSCGDDHIKSPHTSILCFFSVYEKLFNIIFDHGVISDIWLVGYIKPLILSKRLNRYSEKFFVVKENMCKFI